MPPERKKRKEKKRKEREKKRKKERKKERKKKKRKGFTLSKAHTHVWVSIDGLPDCGSIFRSAMPKNHLERKEKKIANEFFISIFQLKSFKMTQLASPLVK